MHIEIISGSPRANSLTVRLATFLKNHLAETTEHEAGLIDLRDWDVPPLADVFTSADLAPEALRPLARRVFDAQAFIFVTPEYNGSYTPALKNLMDHFPKQAHKVFAIATASPGALGGIRAAMQLQQLIFALFGVGAPHMLITPAIDKKFDASGQLTDPSFQNSVDVFVREFLWLAEKLVDEKVPA